jgi:hypothetical protein
MIDSNDVARNTDLSIWDDSEVFTASETGAAKVHLTLRLDPALYRELLKYKKQLGIRTTTAAVERAMKVGLESGKVPDFPTLLRNLVAHTVTQDAMLLAMARQLQTGSEKDADSASFSDYVDRLLEFARATPKSTVDDPLNRLFLKYFEESASELSSKSRRSAGSKKTTV